MASKNCNEPVGQVSAIARHQREGGLTKSHLIHQATDQIRTMAEVLRTSAQQHD